MGTLTIPNLEVALQQHRAAMDFAIQGNQFADVKLFADLMNALLPPRNRIVQANTSMLLGLRKDWSVQCNHCQDDTTYNHNN